METDAASCGWPSGYLGGKDRGEVPENETGSCQRPEDTRLENEAEYPILHLINENVEAAHCPENRTHKTPESKIKNQEKRTTPSLSSSPSLFSGVAPSFKLSPEQEKAVKAAVRLLDDERNEATYFSLYGQASERGRLDAWEVALASTRKARLRSGHMQSDPIAYFRTVLTKTWKLDPDVLRDQVKKQKQAEMKPLESRSSGDMSEPQAWTSFSAQAVAADADNTADGTRVGGGGKAHWNANAPVGDVRSLVLYSVVTAPPATVSESAASAYDALVARIPVDKRDEIVSRAKAMVEKNHPAHCLRGETKPGYLRLITSTCKDLLAQEGL